MPAKTVPPACRWERIRESADGAYSIEHHEFILVDPAGVIIMSSERKYQVLLLPEREVAERGCSLREASAWIGAYNQIIEGEPSLAVIGEELPSPA